VSKTKGSLKFLHWTIVLGHSSII